MRKSAFLVLSLVSGLALAACSEKTQEHAEQTVDAASTDVANSASEAAADTSAALKEAASEGAAAAHDAAGDAARATGKLGEKIQEGAARVEADVQGESKEKAKRD